MHIYTCNCQGDGTRKVTKVQYLCNILPICSNESMAKFVKKVWVIKHPLCVPTPHLPTWWVENPVGYSYQGYGLRGSRLYVGSVLSSHRLGCFGRKKDIRMARTETPSRMK